MRFPKLPVSIRLRSARRRAKAGNNLSRELADRAQFGLEPLEPRMLLAGMPALIDIVAGAGASNPSDFTNVNNTVFFRATDPTNGYELWKSDGTGTGTVLVKDIRPGAPGSYPGYLINVNGTLLFRANDGSNGYELWKSDGTGAGTVQVKDIQPGASNSFTYFLTNVNGTLFFSANDGTSGQELWKSDGTGAGR